MKLGSHVRSTLLDGHLVILDLGSGVYLRLARDASARFVHLVGGRAPRDAADASLAEQARRRGLLDDVPSEGPIPAHELRRPVTLAAWIALRRTHRAVAGYGFVGLYARAARLRPHPRALEEPGRVVAAFLRAEGFTVQRRTPRDCVPRSLALYELLLRAGVSARHVIGVRDGPFAAHAWVEVEGRPTLDHPAFIRTFQPLATLG